MGRLPAGTVTFLFIDIEGSTHLSRAQIIAWAVENGLTNAAGPGKM